MPGRIRSLPPSILEDEDLCALPDTPWRVFISCWALADDHGNLRAGGRYLAAMIFQDTGRVADVDAALTVLRRRKLLITYTSSGQPYAHVVGWIERWQHIPNPGRPKVPVPNDVNATITEASASFVEKSPRPSEGPVEILPRARARSLLDLGSDLGSGMVGRGPGEPQHHNQDQGIDRRPEPEPAGAAPADPWGLAPEGCDPDTHPIDHGPFGGQPAAPAGGAAASAASAPPSTPSASPAAKATPKRAKPRAQGLTEAELTDPERAVLRAILDDPTLGPKATGAAQLARDLLRVAPAVDLPVEIVALGAWVRANPTRAPKTTNAFLLNCTRRKQAELAEAGKVAPVAPARAGSDRPPLPVPQLKPGIAAAAAVLRESAASGPRSLGGLFDRVGQGAKAAEERGS